MVSSVSKISHGNVSTLQFIAIILAAVAFIPLLLVHSTFIQHGLTPSRLERRIPGTKLRLQSRTRPETVVTDKIEDISENSSWINGCFVPPLSSPPKREKPPTGLLVVLAMAPEDRMVRQDALRRTCITIPRQIEYFLESQGLDMLFLVQEEASSWTLEYFQNCFGLTHSPETERRTWKNLDGSFLEAEPFIYGASNQSKTTIYMARTTVDFPHYIRNDLSILKKPITPRSCQAPRQYIQATRWYTRELLHLGILQEYDFFLKVDTDVVFVDTIPFHLLQDMVNKNAVFAHTAEYHPRGSQTCATGIQKAVKNFTETFQQHNRNETWKLSLCSTSPEVQRDADLYYTNFIAGKVSFWQSSWILKWANFLNEFEEGFFTYRWTDQIFWHMAMGLFLGNFQDYVVDYTNLRCMPHSNCWQSSYNFQRFGANAWHKCDNGGFFLHPKDVQAPVEVSKLPRRNLVWNASQPHFHSTYEKDCSGKSG